MFWAGVGQKDWGDLAVKAAIRGMQPDNFEDQASTSWGTSTKIAAMTNDSAEEMLSASPLAAEADQNSPSAVLQMMPLAMCYDA